MIPEYSLPIGSETIYMEDLVEDYFVGLINIPDTSLMSDTLSVFYYDSLFYINPLIFEYEGERTFDFRSLNEKTDYITSAMIRTNCVNGIPARFYFQVFLFDIAHQLVDSVLMLPDGWLLFSVHLLIAWHKDNEHLFI